MLHAHFKKLGSIKRKMKPWNFADKVKSFKIVQNFYFQNFQ